MKWIQASVKVGNVSFSLHFKKDSSKDHCVSDDEAAQAIVKGKPLRWEPGEIPKTREPTMNMTFEQKLETRSISAVASVMDDCEDVVVATVWDDPIQ